MAALVESRSRVRPLRFTFENPRYTPTGWLDARRVASSFVEGIGLVGESSVHRTYQRGRLRENVAYEIWLQEGVLRGVPYP